MIVEKIKQLQQIRQFEGAKDIIQSAATNWINRRVSEWINEAIADLSDDILAGCRSDSIRPVLDAEPFVFMIAARVGKSLCEALERDIDKAIARESSSKK
jgi:hypothetical protein